MPYFNRGREPTMSDYDETHVREASPNRLHYRYELKKYYEALNIYEQESEVYSSAMDSHNRDMRKYNRDMNHYNRGIANAGMHPPESLVEPQSPSKPDITAPSKPVKPIYKATPVSRSANSTQTSARPLSVRAAGVGKISIDSAMKATGKASSALKMTNHGENTGAAARAARSEYRVAKKATADKKTSERASAAKSLDSKKQASIQLSQQSFVLRQKKNSQSAQKQELPSQHSAMALRFRGNMY